MLIGRTLLSRYKIINKLGSGGFGDTYLAQDIALPGNPSCVVKHLKPKHPNPAVFPIAKRLFDREAEFLYRLGKHNQIPTLYAHFEEGGEFYLVQEFVDGDDLSKEIIPGKPWSEEQTVKLLQEILEVLAVVHQENVIHRDIKPSNIMRRKRDGKLMLIDFGAVKEISALTVNSQGQTSVTVPIGSPGYMPSEQAKGRPKLASDVYAVGMIGIQTLIEAKLDQLSEDPNTGEIIWRNQVPQMSDRLADILTTMVRDHFSQRYQNASEALQGLMSTVVYSTPSADVPTVPIPEMLTMQQPSSSPSQPTQLPPKPAKLSPLAVLVGLAVAAIAGVALINRPSYLPPPPVNPPPTAKPQSRTTVEGTWSIAEARALDGKKYIGTVVIQKTDQIYHLFWQTSTGNLSGVAFFENGHLFAGWGSYSEAGYGIVVYKIGKDGTLDGKWTYLGSGGEIGTETATGGTPGQVGGSYLVAGTNPGSGSQYKGVLNIRQTGETYQLFWSVGKSYRGVGLRSDDWLVVSWGKGSQLGVTDYAINGDTATGRWTLLNQTSLGVENLLRRQN